MSNIKHTNATLADYGFPIFPDILYEFSQALCDYGIINLYGFESACKLTPEFTGIDRPITSDGYHWFCGIYFTIGDKKIAILIPWRTDYNALDGNEDDRSPAIYLAGNVNIEQFVRHLIDVIKKYGEKEKQQIAEYHREIWQRHHDYFVFMYRECNGNLSQEHMAEYELAMAREEAEEVKPLPLDATNYFKLGE